MTCEERAGRVVEVLVEREQLLNVEAAELLELLSLGQGSHVDAELLQTRLDLLQEEVLGRLAAAAHVTHDAYRKVGLG